MAVRGIVRYGDPRLVAPNREVVDFEDAALASLLSDLQETCWAAPGYGLAAPQIGVNLRVSVIDLSVGKDPSQVIVLVNPRVVEAAGKVRDEEGCLSFPEIVEIIERPEEVAVEAFGRDGRKRTLHATDLLARAFCHEVDHLDSRLFVDRMSSLKRGLILRKVLKRQRIGSW